MREKNPVKRTPVCHCGRVHLPEQPKHSSDTSAGDALRAARRALADKVVTLGYERIKSLREDRANLRLVHKVLVRAAAHVK